MTAIRQNSEFSCDVDVDCLIIGGGAAGLTAALAAENRGLSVLVAEREDKLSGSTALSSGLIPAAKTKAQMRQKLDDDQECFIADIMAKNENTADIANVKRCVLAVSQAIDWLEDSYDIPFHVLDSFLYPGHSRYRMHAVPEVTGAALITRLEQAAIKRDIFISCNLKVTELVISEDGRICGAQAVRPDGSIENIGASSIILACNGYGGSPELVSQHIPEMKEALYFGHPGNQGEAIIWGEALGAKLLHLSGYQGHGSVAHPHGVLVTWALMMEGGVQVNLDGQRFSNEHKGYSEQAVNVLSQPQKIAFNIFDERLLGLGRDFEDFRNAEAAGAVTTADTIEELAIKLGLPPESLSKTLNMCAAHASSGRPDQFGRMFKTETLLQPRFAAVKVTGALFHTQGGLAIDDKARVIRNDGSVIMGLFACGGAACGVSGPDVSGYLSGNGLLTALALGYVAGNAV